MSRHNILINSKRKKSKNRLKFFDFFPFIYKFDYIAIHMFSILHNTILKINKNVQECVFLMFTEIWQVLWYLIWRYICTGF